VRRAIAAAAVVAALVVAAPAGAATHEQVRTLARAALAGDAHALARLRAIQSVDGVRVNLRRALDADAGDRAGRLAALAASSPGGAATGAAARADAARILREQRFAAPSRERSGDLHKPGFVHRVTRWLERLFGHLGGGGGSASAPSWLAPVAWLVVIALLGFVLFLVVRALTESGPFWRRRRKGGARGRAARVDEPPATSSAAELLRLADEAEAAGDLERALRLRFRGGLRRLQERRVVPWRDSLTSREVSRRLRSRDFDTLARTFDEVAYGRRPPEPGDVAEAREGWSRVVEEARPR
jgi:hypothetical protein